MSKIPFKTAFSPPVRVFYYSELPSMTSQSFKAECDINTILAKYKKTGLLDHVNRYQGQYGDFIEAVDYQSALHHIAAANESFMTLPSEIRARFSNDPSQFLSFVHDPKNVEEMRKMGLLKPLSVDLGDGKTEPKSVEQLPT